MKKIILWILFVVVALAVITVGLFVPVWRKVNVSPAPKVTEEGVVCHDLPKYFVIEKSLAPNVGSDILVKYKTLPTQDVSCTYTVTNGDFELANLDATYFLDVTDNFLLLDTGTAPEPRGLVVYDLRSHTKVFSDTYAKPVTILADTITYLSKSTIKPTTKNCPKLSEYTTSGLGAVIMSKVSVDLTTLVKTDLGENECLATQ